jgi:hypothetical protein
MTRRTLVALALLSLVTCGEEKAVETLVRRYNEESIRAYHLNDPSRMPEVAAKRESERLIVLVDLKASNRLVLEATLERLQITSTQVTGGNEAVVDTEERWRYFDRPVTPGKQPAPTVVAEMKMRYQCVKEGRAWKVAEVTTLQNEILEPKGYRPQQRAEQAADAGGR